MPGGEQGVENVAAIFSEEKRCHEKRVEKEKGCKKNARDGQPQRTNNNYVEVMLRGRKRGMVGNREGGEKRARRCMNHHHEGERGTLKEGTAQKGQRT